MLPPDPGAAPPPLVDIGANLTNGSFQDDLPAVLKRAQASGVDTLIVTGTSVAASRAAVEVAERYPGLLYATAGIHPHEADSCSPDSLLQLRELLRHPAVCAIGETGLDFKRNFSPPDQQESAFCAQLELACETGVPVFLHERDAHGRQLEILSEYRDRLGAAVAHCFTGDRKMLHAYLDLDLYIGITGWICDERRGQALQDAVVDVPLDRLMLESDAPYLLPRQMQPPPSLPRSRRNEPCTLIHVLRRIASLRGDDVTALAARTRANSFRFFGLREIPASCRQ